MTATAWLRAPATILAIVALAACAGAPQEGAPQAGGVAPGRGSPALQVDFTEEGAVFAPAGGAWSFRATPWGFGCDGELVAPGEARSVTRGERVTYARAGLDEWYARGPRGVEQGFTLPAPPACRRAGGGGVVIALGVGLGAVVAGGGREARLQDASGREVLRYADLRVVDAAGRDLPAAIEARGEGLAIRFDDEGAAYPVVVDPLIWAQQARIVAPNADATGDDFGAGVALSGGTFLVGAPLHQKVGAAYVFVGSHASWALQQELDSIADSENALFGAAVALSGDTAFVGAPGADDAEGEVEIFLRKGTTWALAQALGAGPLGTGAFGTSIAISGDTAIVGAPGVPVSAAYVYLFSGGAWTQQKALGDPAGGGQGDGFGTSVALDGDTAIVGAPGDPQGDGAAYVFVRSGTTWTLEQTLTAADGVPGGSLGLSVAVEGDTAVVGSLHPAGGAAYVFARAGTTWTQTQELTGTPPATAFGQSVALSGGVVVVGGDAGQGASGGVYVFAPPAGNASVQAVLTPSAATNGDRFGASVAIEGSTVVVGAPAAASPDTAAYVFQQGTATGDACTAAGACLSGNCVDGVCCAAASCAAAGPCNAAEHCQPGTGACSSTPINTGKSCGTCVEDGICKAGVCEGGPRLCPPVDACHEWGTCDAASNACSSPEKPDGIACPGGACAAGVCVPASSASSGGGTNPGSGGCGCAVGSAPSGGALGVGLGFLLFARRRSRRRP